MSQAMNPSYENEALYANASPEVWQQIGAAHAHFAQQVPELGGKTMDGNALCGYCLIEAKDLAQACAIAKVCPAPHGGVEVRPILEIPGR